MQGAHTAVFAAPARGPSRSGLLAVIGLSCLWLVLNFLLLLLAPVPNAETIVVRVVMAAAPVAVIWLFYLAGTATPKAMTALMVVILIVSELSIRNRALNDTSADLQNLVKLVFWGAGMLVALLNWRHLRVALREPVFLAMTLYALWAIFTSVYSPIFTYSFASGFAFLSVLLFAGVIRQMVPAQALLKASIGALTPLLIIALLMYVFVPERAMALMEAGNIQRLAAPLGTPNSLGRVAAIVFLLCFVGWRLRWLKLTSPLVWVSVSCAVGCIVLAQSRTAILAAALALAAVLLVGRPIRFLLAASLVLVGTLLFSISDTNPRDVAKSISRTGSVSEVTSLTGRTQIWAFAWQEIKQAPVLGYGNASTKYYMPLKFRTFWGWTSTHVHNMWLQIWFTTGLVGVVLLFGVFLTQFLYWRRSKDLLSFVFLIFAFTIGLSEAAFINGVPSVLTAIWFFWLAGPQNLAQSASTPKHHSARPVWSMARP